MTRSIGQNSRRIRRQSHSQDAWTKSTRDTSRTNGRNAASFKGGWRVDDLRTHRLGQRRSCCPNHALPCRRRHR